MVRTLEQERAREEVAKDMSGEERLPEERWRRVDMSGSLRGRKSEEMTQLNTSSPWGQEAPFESQKEHWQFKSPQDEEISGGGRKGAFSAIRGKE